MKARALARTVYAQLTIAELWGAPANLSRPARCRLSNAGTNSEILSRAPHAPGNSPRFCIPPLRSLRCCAGRDQPSSRDAYVLDRRGTFRPSENKQLIEQDNTTKTATTLQMKPPTLVALTADRGFGATKELDAEKCASSANRKCS
jgi:hypothetical protein